MRYPLNATPLLLAALAALLAPPARTLAAAAAERAQAGKLEEVIVTAQRREESAQTIGIALSVLSARELAAAGIDKVNGFADLTPSLEIEPAFGSGQPQFRLRGVGFIDYTANNSSPVGVSVDGVALPFPIQTQGQIFDIGRVEVLRGPQGTLYGRNTTGGAVNFIVNTPTIEPHSGLSAEYGSFGALAADGYLSGPLGPELSGRLAVATEQGGAWQWNRVTGQKLGDKDTLALRAQLEYRPNPGTRIRLTLHTATDKSDAMGNQLLTPFTPAPAGAAVVPADSDRYATGWSLAPGFASTLGIAPGSKPGLDNSNSGGTLTANLDFGDLRFTSITAYDKLTRRELGDWDATQYFESDIYFHDDVEVYSEELRLASAGSGPLAWVAGGYYAHDQLAERFYGDFTQIYGASALTSYRQTGESLAVFAQASYQLNERLKAILGLRPDRECRDLIGLNTLFGGASLNGGPANRSLSNSDLSGRAELDYALDSGALAYGSISRGVKSGGFTAHNTTIPNPKILDPFQPEKLLAYELGLKLEFERALRLNAAAFHYDYRDQQLLSKFLDPVTNSYIGRFINAPRSRIDGGELELEWLPAEGLQLSQYLSYKSGRYTQSVLNSALADFNGKDIDFPKLSYGGELGYGWPVGAYRLRAETNYSYHDQYDQRFLLENVSAGGELVGPPLFQIAAYWLVNASLTLSPPAAAHWNLMLWARNLTNERYVLTKNFFLPGNNIDTLGHPATVGLRFEWRH